MSVIKQYIMSQNNNVLWDLFVTRIKDSLMEQRRR